MIPAKHQFMTMDEYISTFPEDVQDLLQRIRQVIHETVPEATEAISYQIPAFKLNGVNLIHFAAWKTHIGVYPIPSGSESFIKEIAPYITGKGTVQFPFDKPIPYKLIQQMVKYRVEDTQR